eukprot:c19533_g1_i1.p1 GENE.c19533_g1_i1~~c19533_g1_i1.p1  ORF type:complete len:361 (+),score=86.71 c19533_g1_i1:95-1177(+)
MYDPKNLSKGVAFILMVAASIFLGTWPNIFKRNETHVRVELQYYVYAPMVCITAIVFTCIIGNVGSDKPDLFDDLNNLSTRGLRVFLALLAGATIATGNMLYVYGAHRVGISVGMFIQAAGAIVIGATLNYILEPTKSDPLLLFIAVGLSFLALCACTVANKIRSSQVAPANTVSYIINEDKETKKESSSVGVLFCVFSSICTAFFSPIFSMSVQGKDNENATIKVPEDRLSPYTAIFFWGIGFTTAGIIIPFCVLQSEKIRMPSANSNPLNHGKFYDYFLSGIAGVITGFANICIFTGGDSAGFAAALSISMSNPLIGCLWGIFYWHEFSNVPPSVWVMVSLMYLFYIASIIVVFFSIK